MGNTLVVRHVKDVNVWSIKVHTQRVYDNGCGLGLIQVVLNSETKFIQCIVHVHIKTINTVKFNNHRR